LFILSSGDGSVNFDATNIIKDFRSDDGDLLSLFSGLSYNDLFITGSVSFGVSSTLIKEASTGLYLAKLEGVSKSSITRNDFIEGVQSNQFGLA